MSSLASGCGSSSGAGDGSGSGGGGRGGGGATGRGGTGGATGRGGTSGGAAGNGGTAGSGGTAGGGGGSVVDAGTDGSLGDCGIICGSDQQGVRVRTPGVGAIQCACVSLPDAGRCTDCTCGQTLCARYDAMCTGFSLETGLLCTQPG